MLVVGFPAGLSPTSFHLSPRLGACGRVPGRLVSHFFSFVSHFFSLSPTSFHLSPTSFHLSGWVLVVGFAAGLSPRPDCLPLPFVCLPVLFICLPGWVIVVGFPAGLSPTSFHLSPRLGACGRVPGWLVSHFLSFVSHFFSFVSRETYERKWETSQWETNEKKWETNEKKYWLVSHFLSYVSHGSGRQASREPDHKHPAWETNEKKWETNDWKWETSQPGTRPQAPSLGDK